MATKRKKPTVGTDGDEGRTGGSATDSGDPKEPTFEQSVRRLGEIVEHLESGELPLEESIRLFEEGVRLARTSQRRLDAAEQRVEELLAVDEKGNPIVRELESE